MTTSRPDLEMAYAAAWEAGEPSPAKDLTRGVRLLSIPELDELPEVSWLVEDVLPAGGDAMLYGTYGSFKSLLAVDLACAVALGRPWHGRSTSAATVVYIAGEGQIGLRSRFDAYRDYHGLDSLGDFFVVPAPLSLLLPVNATALLDSLSLRLPSSATEMPLLLVVDTVRKCTPGGEENDSGMVSDALSFLDRVRRDYPLLTSLLIHHPGTDGKRPRGSSAWEADTDTVLKADRAGKELRVTLKCEKQRDSEPFDDLVFNVQPHHQSLVIEGGGQARNQPRLTPGEAKILGALTDQWPRSATWTEWGRLAEVGPSVLLRAQSKFLELGYVQKAGASRSSGYSATDKGLEAIRDFQTTTSFQITSMEVLPSLQGGLKGPCGEAADGEGVDAPEGLVP